MPMKPEGRKMVNLPTKKDVRHKKVECWNDIAYCISRHTRKQKFKRNLEL